MWVEADLGGPDGVDGEEVEGAGVMAMETGWTAEGSSRSLRKKVGPVGCGMVRVVSTKPSGTGVGSVKGRVVATESMR